MNIYVGHPFSMKEENKRETEEIIVKLVKESPEHTYFSPIHSFGFLYDKVDYQAGIEMCFKLLKMCDMMYVYGDWENSKGCKAEIKFCKENGIPYVIYDDNLNVISRYIPNVVGFK